MGFYHILQSNNYDWDKSLNIFYNLTDLQIAFLVKAAPKPTVNKPKDNFNDIEKEEFDLKWDGVR